MVTRYERGRAIEYRIQRELEAVGYYTVRTAGSHGKFDVIAWNIGGVRFIQAKSFIKRATSAAADIDEIRQIFRPERSSAELWVWKQRAGWQAKVRVGAEPASDALLPLAESRHEGPEDDSTPALKADGLVYTHDRAVPFERWWETATASQRSSYGRSPFGTPASLAGIGLPHLCDVLSGIRGDVKEEG